MTELRPLGPTDWAGAAWFLDCEPEAIRAVAEIEAPRGGYLNDGQVTILFERHIFHRLTGGAHGGARAPVPAKYSEAGLISESSTTPPGGYGPPSLQHVRLQTAVELDRDAALQSASWGRFQIMGFNWKLAGYESLQAFVTGMISGGEAEHLRAFCCFIRGNEELAQALRDRDWSTFARIYNGRAYAKHNYHGRIAEAYQRLALGERRA